MSKMKDKQMKANIKKHLPKGFKCLTSKDGLIVTVYAKLDQVGGFDEANKAVRNLCKKFKLDEIGAGTLLSSMQRDWELIDLEVERKMHNEAQCVLKHMKNFFKKYSNRYCSSSKTYDVIESMRSLVETDEA